MKGISTVVATILMLMITIALAGTAYLYISGVFTSKTRTLSMIDSYCAGTNGSVIIRNEGPDTIRAGEQTLVAVSNACTTGPTLADINSSATATYTFSTCSTNQIHQYRLVGPANAVAIEFRCA